MRYQVEPTLAQRVMIVCAGIILVALIVFGWWEVRGILSGVAEQTFSEWVWDLDLWVLIPLTVVSFVLAITFGWFTIHIWEGYVRRRRREREAVRQAMERLRKLAESD